MRLCRIVWRGWNTRIPLGSALAPRVLVVFSSSSGIRFLQTPPGRAAYQRDEPVGIFGILRPRLDQLRLTVAVILIPVQRSQPCDLVRDADRDATLFGPSQRVLLHEPLQVVVCVCGDPHTPASLDGAITQRSQQSAPLHVRLVDVPE